MTPTRFTVFRYYAKEYTRMNKKRASFIIGGLFAGALVAGACTATPDEVEGTATAVSTSTQVAVPSAATYTPPTATAVDREDLFIAVLDERNFPYGGDKELAIDTGLAACEALDSGVPVVKLASILIGSYSPEDGGTFLGAAVGALCDEHMPKVESFRAQFGGN